MNSHLGMLGDGHHKGKYRFGYNLLKPIRTTSKHPHAIDNAGLLSYTTFSWLTPLAHLAFKKGELLTDDVWPLSTHETSDVTCRRLERLWQQELQECGPEEASLGRVVWVFCRTRLIISIVCLMVTQLAGFCGPVSTIQPLPDFHNVGSISVAGAHAFRWPRKGTPKHFD
uniref:Multidrug resistance-associated protein 5 n=2 Tax=Sphaerodactylus townsendi TaxID=933632 RepID=A0ACB8FCZ4_9SAUR